MPRGKKQKETNSLLNAAVRAGRKYVRQIERDGLLLGLQGAQRDRLVFYFAECYLDGGRTIMADLQRP